MYVNKYENQNESVEIEQESFSYKPELIKSKVRDTREIREGGNIFLYVRERF